MWGKILRALIQAELWEAKRGEILPYSPLTRCNPFLLSEQGGNCSLWDSCLSLDLLVLILALILVVLLFLLLLLLLLDLLLLSPLLPTVPCPGQQDGQGGGCSDWGALGRGGGVAA